MNKNIALVALTAVAIALAALKPWKALAQTPVFQVEECATIRWDGRENTHVIRPNGKVEFLGKILGTASRPNRTDERSFYLNIAMNALAKEGYQFAGRTENDIVMKRAVPK